MKRFRYIILPNLLWKYTGWGLIDLLYSYYWLNIKHREAIWKDADSSQCKLRWCRYCGKGTLLTKENKNNG